MMSCDKSFVTVNLNVGIGFDSVCILIGSVGQILNMSHILDDVGLNSNNDINKGTLDHTLNNMRQRRVHMDKQQDEDYKREMKKLYKKISAKNRVCPIVWKIQ